VLVRGIVKWNSYVRPRSLYRPGSLKAVSRPQRSLCGKRTVATEGCDRKLGRHQAVDVRVEVAIGAAQPARDTVDMDRVDSGLSAEDSHGFSTHIAHNTLARAPSPDAWIVRAGGGQRARQQPT